MKSLIVLRSRRKIYWHCQSGILEASVNVADVEILSDHDSNGSASKGRRRRECNEHTFGSVVMKGLGRVEQ